MKIISRGKGKSAIAAAAYRAGEKITNEQTGTIHDYTRKKNVAKSTIILPENAPEEYRDRAVLWNAVEKVEKASNSQLDREIEISLPKELSYFQKSSLAFEYVKENFTSKGMIADMNFHDLDSDNPHVHIMLTVRPFNEDGTWGNKQKKVYHLDENGEKIYDPKKRQYKCSKEQTTDWNEKHKAEEWRASWADMCNAELERLGYDDRIDHRSFERQGIDQIPTIHLGTACHQMEQRGIRTERGDINRAIKLANAELKNIKTTLRKLEAELLRLQDEQEQEEIATQEIVSQEVPSTITAPFEGYTKAHRAEWEKVAENLKTIELKPSTPKPSKPMPDTNSTKNAKPKTNTAPVAKNKTANTPTGNANTTPTPKPKPKPRTLKQVELELSIVESKILGLKRADDVDMLYGYKIQDIERNLSSAGFWEQRKMNKEIARQEKLRSDFQKETLKTYGTKTQVESEKAKLLREKTQIENATGVTAAREAEQERKRDEVIQRQQSRDRYYAERKAKKLENPNKGKNVPSK